jgi:hypothetical protein
MLPLYSYACQEIAMDYNREVIGVRLMLLLMAVLVLGCGLRTVLTRAWPGSDAPIAAVVPTAEVTPTPLYQDYHDCPAPVIPMPVQTMVPLVDSFPTLVNASVNPTTYTVTWVCNGALLPVRVGDTVVINMPRNYSAGDALYVYSPDVLKDEGAKRRDWTLKAIKRGISDVLFQNGPVRLESDYFIFSLHLVVR